MVVIMITPRQIRAARALLGWSQQQLADKAIVSLNAVTSLEKGKVDSRVSTITAIEKALKTDNVVFMDFQIEEEENVYPMVPAGEAINRMIGGMACLLIVCLPMVAFFYKTEIP
jgi:predicted transcriptional regulator